MAVQLDHVFICCDVGAPEAQALLKLGLIEGARNTHSGQGTANRRFFFKGGFIELLWVANPTEAQSALAAPTRLWPRWADRRSGSCPFGIACSPAGAEVVPPPFETWDYRPGYLPAGKSIRFARATPLQEPELLYLAWPNTLASSAARPVDHAAPLLALKSASVGLPAREVISESLQAAVAAGLITVYASPSYELQLEFSAPEKLLFDLRPLLPLVLRGSPG